MFSFTAILGTSALLSSFALADNLFAGCYASLPSTVTGPASAPALRSSSAHCSAGCTSSTHSYFNATSGQCFCSNGTPYSDSLRLGNQDSCGLYYDNRNIRTSYMSLNPQCYANKPAGITDANTKAYTGLNSCLSSCKNGLRATYWARNMAESATVTYLCSCVTPSSYGAGTTCGPDTFFGYYHTAEAAASGLTKRKQREAAASKAAARLSFCPNGWTACLIPGGDEGSYECIDVTRELESCGGCMSGQFYAANATVGENCSTMSNAIKGGSTCDNGKCAAFACERGYRLINGQCL